MRFVAGLLALTLVVGCKAPSESTSETTRPDTAALRVETIPSGATLRVPRLFFECETPCTLPVKTRDNERIVIRKAGFAQFQGTLDELMETRAKIFMLRLSRP